MKTLFLLIPWLWLFNTGSLLAQTNPSYTLITGSIEGSTNFSSGSIVFANTAKTVSAPLLRERNTSSKLYLKLDAGNDYVKQSSGWNFKVVVDLSYQFNGSLTVAKTLTITHTQPERLEVEDVQAYFTGTSPSLTISVTNITINDGAGSPSALSGLVQDFVNDNLRLTANLAREYEVDVRLQTNNQLALAPVAYPVSISNRLATFSWQPGVTAYPNYEVQVLKLYNTDPQFKDDDNQIAATVNWNNALSVETQSWRNYITLTLGEGTGYYLWRVRPIGTYFAGGAGNSENYGNWSYAYAQGSAQQLNKNILLGANPSSFAFYFSDPDENLNWIYNRVFTEAERFDPASGAGVKSSEGISYADRLLNTRQTQKYNSSENTKIISQSVLDYSGRPTLNTLPVPVSGDLSGYRPNFVKSGSNLYTAADFDGVYTYSAPATVNQSGTDFSYYSNSSAHANVPAADDYPYQRSLYKNDGLNRVGEESGVGATHAIGSPGGTNRTVRYQYGQANYDDLLRLFGEEAPVPQSVTKTIVTDQNGMQSITYTSKEGKVIVTALSNTVTSGMLPIGNGAGSRTNTYTAGERNSTEHGIESSLRLLIGADNTVIRLSYINQGLPSSSTLCPSGDCNLAMRLFLVDLERNITYTSDADNTAGITDFIPSPGFTFSPTWRLLSLDASSPGTLTPGGSDYDEITLNAGEYIIGKEIFSTNKGSYTDSLVNQENDKFRPVLEAISDTMQSVNSADAYAAFTAYMATLKTMIDSYRAGGGVSSASLIAYLGMDPDDLPAGYTFPTDFTLAAISTNTADVETSNLKISTGCCGDMSVPIPRPSPCYLCDGSPVYTATASISTMTLANKSATADSIIPYGINDFKANGSWAGLTPAQKRNAIYPLVYHEFIGPLKERMAEELLDTSSGGSSDLWKIAPGFSYHSLHFMISNMLISQYYTGSAVSHSNTWYAAEANAAGGYSLSVPVASLSPAYNYDCKKLYEAWLDAMEPLNTFDVSESGDDTDILTDFNDQEGADAGQDNADDDGNWLLDNQLVKQYLKRKMSEELEDNSNSGDGPIPHARFESVTSIPSSFLSFAGYQFAAIIDGTPLPSYISSSLTPLPDDYASFGETPFGSGFYTTVSTGSTNNTYVPYLFSVNGNTAELTTYTCNGSSSYQLYYPYILKPEWMFKYYVYNVFENKQTTSPAVNYIDDDDVLLPHQVMADIKANYNQPFSYLTAAAAGTLTAANLCPTQPALTYTLSGTQYTMAPYMHLNWRTDERISFYDRIKNAPRCFASKGIDTYSTMYTAGPLPTCEIKDTLVARALRVLAAERSNCTLKATQIRNALVEELTSSCYTIAGCTAGGAAGIVSEAEIDQMTAAVIANMQAQVDLVVAKFNAIALPGGTTACSAPSAFTMTYNPALCDLPSCSQQDCQELVLYKDNTLGVTPSRKFSVIYFADCDQKLLDMLRNGSFLPYIAPLDGCDKEAKPWRNGACEPETTCGDYGERNQNCPAEGYSKYSKKYSITTP